MGTERRGARDRVSITMDMDTDSLKMDWEKGVTIGTNAFKAMAERVAELEPDCEYLATLEFAYGNVLLLEGLGILTPEFALSFAEAVNANRDVAWTLTPEARQSKLGVSVAQRVYRIQPEDRAEPYPGSPRSPPPSSYRMDAEGVVDLDGPWTPGTTVVDTDMDADEARLPVYDRGAGLYTGLTEFGHWVTARDEYDDLLSKERFESFARFITGTSGNQALLATGSVLVLVGADFLPATVRAVGIAAGGVVLRRSARRLGTAGQRQHVAEAGAVGVAAGLGQLASAFPTLEGFVAAIRAALTEPAGFTGPFYRFAENVAYRVGPQLHRLPFFGFDAITGEQAIHATRLQLAGYLGQRTVQTILKWPLLTQFVLALTEHRQTLAIGTILSTFYYYFGYHHAHRYVPSRQRYYLAINSAKAFAAKGKLLRGRMKALDKKIALYPKYWPPPAGRGRGAPAPIPNPAKARDQGKSAGIGGRLTNIQTERASLQFTPVLQADVWQRGGPAPGRGGPPNQCPRTPRGKAVKAGDDDLEKACCDVDDLVTRLLAVEVEIDNLEAAVDQEMQNFGIPLQSSLDGWSVVDQAFAKLGV